jgi:hypothetical protein
VSVWLVRASQWVSLGVLAIAFGYAVLEGGGRSPVDWNISVLLIGIAALVHWRLADPADEAPFDGALACLGRRARSVLRRVATGSPAGHALIRHRSRTRGGPHTDNCPNHFRRSE